MPLVELLLSPRPGILTGSAADEMDEIRSAMSFASAASEVNPGGRGVCWGREPYDFARSETGRVRGNGLRAGAAAAAAAPTPTPSAGVWA